MSRAEKSGKVPTRQEYQDFRFREFGISKALMMRDRGTSQ
jgi:hypothetical protein